MESFLGLPLHPLVVHAVVVVGPLTALLLTAYAISALRVRTSDDSAHTWADRFVAWARWLLPVAALVSAVVAFVAVEAGEAFEHSRPALPPNFEEHAEAGDRAKLFAILLFVVTIILVLVTDRWFAQRISGLKPLQALTVVRWIVALAAIALAVTMTVFIIRAGHSGASLVWG